jgi:hypothetical protein
MVSKEEWKKRAKDLIRLKSIQYSWLEPRGMIKNTESGLK